MFIVQDSRRSWSVCYVDSMTLVGGKHDQGPYFLWAGYCCSMRSTLLVMRTQFEGSRLQETLQGRLHLCR